MKNFETTKKALNRARRWYQGAIRAFEDERWDDVVYSYEMAVEQALKGILILYGIEYPKKHDISGLLLILEEMDVPDFFSKKIDKYAQILNILVKKRGPAAYGYVEGIKKEEFKEDAINLRSNVEEILDNCERLFDQFIDKNSNSNTS
ncbi:MAG: HEPN domain protein [Promethearchaeota archaeon]|nr:MAG: HEPN domain protein [Candidatus Lokiarchaeota archaeon]